jgi:hypothetical protein
VVLDLREEKWSQIFWLDAPTRELMLGSMTLPVLDLFCGVMPTVRLLACSAVALSSIRARSANAWRR